jgi:signal recognition particle GTPase
LKELGINTLNFPSFYDFQANSRVNKVTSGSVVTEIAVNSDAVSGDANKLMQTASFSDFAVVSHSIVTNSDSSSSVNLGLVLGVSIPLGVLRTFYPI